MVAAAAAAPAVLRDLIALGADPNAADHAGRTALHLGAAYGLPAVLQVTGRRGEGGGKGPQNGGGGIRSRDPKMGEGGGGRDPKMW